MSKERMRNEQTSREVAAKAGRVLKTAEQLQHRIYVLANDLDNLCNDIESIAVSALTQAPDKPKRARRK